MKQYPRVQPMATLHIPNHETEYLVLEPPVPVFIADHLICMEFRVTNSSFSEVVDKETGEVVPWGSLSTDKRFPLHPAVRMIQVAGPYILNMEVAETKRSILVKEIL